MDSDEAMHVAIHLANAKGCAIENTSSIDVLRAVHAAVREAVQKEHEFFRDLLLDENLSRAGMAWALKARREKWNQ